MWSSEKRSGIEKRRSSWLDLIRVNGSIIKLVLKQRHGFVFLNAALEVCNQADLPDSPSHQVIGIITFARRSARFSHE